MLTHESAILIVRVAAHDLATNFSKPDVAAVWQEATDALTRKIRAEYETKSRGGTDDAGIQWEKTKKFAETGRMMIDTGNLLDHIKVEYENGKIIVDVSMVPYARKVLAKRPAWPTDGSIPESWWEEFLRALIGAFKRMLQHRLAAA